MLNELILKAMRSLDNPKLFTTTTKEWRQSAYSSTTVYPYATYAASQAADAVYYADTANYADAADSIDTANYWLDRHFYKTGEDKQDYINEVERLR